MIESKIDAFNEKQEEQLKSFKAAWLNIASSEASDQAAVELVVGNTYARAGLAPPVILWCESPWQLVCMDGLLRLLTIARGTDISRLLRTELRKDPWARLWQKLQGYLEGSLDALIQATNDNPTGLYGTLPLTGTGGILSLDGELHEVFASVETVLAPLLGVRAKLRLRDELSSSSIVGTSQLLSTLPRLGRAAFVPSHPAASLSSELGSQSRKLAEDLCSTYAKEGARSVNQELPRPRAMNALFMLLHQPLALVGNHIWLPKLAIYGFSVQNLAPSAVKETPQPLHDWLFLKHSCDGSGYSAGVEPRSFAASLSDFF